jgi:hypothetical protein
MVKKKIFSAFVLAVGIYILMAQPAVAAIVDNPGNVSVTVAITLGAGDQMFTLPAATLNGRIDSSGNLTIPAAGIVIPDRIIPDIPIIGSITIRVSPTADGTGRLNPITGDATATLSLRVSVLASILPSGCGLGPVSVTATTGTSGQLQGVPYDMAAGMATLVANDFTIPGTSGCGFLGAILDGLVGLPFAAGVAYVSMDTAFDPIITGS